jgi:flagellar export protein FliJ
MFKFRLASVLRLREHIKNQKHWELRELHETRRQMVAEIDGLESELAGGSAVPKQGQIFTAIELRLRAEHGQSLAKRIKAKRAVLATLEEKLSEKRAELIEAMRAVKSLEQLRQRHEVRYRREQNAAEQKFAD